MSEVEQQIRSHARHAAAQRVVLDGATLRRDAVRHPLDPTVDRTVRQRPQRLVMLAAAAVLAMVLAIGVAVWRSGDSNPVRSGPDTTVPAMKEGPQPQPAAELPQLGLPAQAGRNHVYDFSPARQLANFMLPVGVGENATTPVNSPAGSAVLHEMVTDASLTDALHSLNPNISGVETQVRGTTGLVSTDGSASTIVVWPAAPGVVASLSLISAGGSPDLVEEAVTFASKLVELDDATWDVLLLGNPPATYQHLGLTGDDGFTEVSEVNPGRMDAVVLDAPGQAAATFSLAMTAGGDSAALGRLLTDANPVPVTVRGTPAWVIRYTPQGSTHPGHQLIWTGPTGRYTLNFSDSTTMEQAVEIADRLSVFDDQEWLALLQPSTLRTDLVPMPR